MDPLQKRFNAVYDEYADAIFRHMYLRISDRERALELMQEVFSRFWQRLCTGVQIEHPKAFLYRSAHNAVVNELRDRKKIASLESLMEEGFDVMYEAADAEQLSLQKEIVEKLHALEEPYKESLVLRYVDGLAVKEIAALLEESENTISVRLKRGVEKLRKLYE